MAIFVQLFRIIFPLWHQFPVSLLWLDQDMGSHFDFFWSPAPSFSLNLSPFIRDCNNYIIWMDKFRQELNWKLKLKKSVISFFASDHSLRFVIFKKWNFVFQRCFSKWSSCGKSLFNHSEYRRWTDFLVDLGIQELNQRGLSIFFCSSSLKLCKPVASHHVWCRTSKTHLRDRTSSSERDPHTTYSVLPKGGFTIRSCSARFWSLNLWKQFRNHETVSSALYFAPVKLPLFLVFKFIPSWVMYLYKISKFLDGY